MLEAVVQENEINNGSLGWLRVNRVQFSNRLKV